MIHVPMSKRLLQCPETPCCPAPTAAQCKKVHPSCRLLSVPLSFLSRSRKSCHPGLCCAPHAFLFLAQEPVLPSPVPSRAAGAGARLRSEGPGLSSPSAISSHWGPGVRANSGSRAQGSGVRVGQGRKSCWGQGTAATSNPHLGQTGWRERPGWHLTKSKRAKGEGYLQQGDDQPARLSAGLFFPWGPIFLSGPPSLHYFPGSLCSSSLHPVLLPCLSDKSGVPG